MYNGWGRKGPQDPNKPKKRTSQAWKDAERKIAAMFGTKRVGPTGRTGPDLHNHRFAVEVKERKTLPKWILAALTQVTTSSPESLVPTVVLHQLGSKHVDDLIVFKLSTFLAYVEHFDPQLAPGFKIPAVPVLTVESFAESAEEEEDVLDFYR